MCGINAVFNGSRQDLDKMVNASTNRGYIQNITEYKNALIHFNWLPITDSDAPIQPYIIDDYAVWFNGYISNYKELASKYNINLSTNCDTELLAKFLVKFNGKRLDELNGFFAVLYHNGSVWDMFTDRYGIKKLYTHHDFKSRKMFISSELKPILNACNPKLDIDAVNDFKYSLGVMNTNTLYEGVHRVRSISIPTIQPIEISYEDAKVELKRLMLQSVERNRTNLSTCVFLSGGIDSGIIAKYIQPNYCFSVDYLNSEYSEIENIKLNSTSQHIVLMCNDSMFNKYIPLVVDLLADPKVGSSYTNYALSELASKFCTVNYSGAGGDEFFGGYPHRTNKDINDVIKRTSHSGTHYNITHYEYDLLFLRSVLNIEDTIGGSFTMETRYPLLDNDLVNFALSLPNEYKENKKILKDISGLDEKVINSKKKGFSNPHLNNEKWVESFKL